MRFIPTRVHAILDYLMGIVLIAVPWALGFAETNMGENGAATWVPVIIGAGMILAALMTDYEYGAVSLISMRTHLGIDIAAGILLAASPWLFGFYELVWIPHLVLGLAEIGAGLTTKTTPTNVPMHAGGRREAAAR